MAVTVMDQKQTEELRDLLIARSAALVRRDIDALRQILADDFVYTNASGEVFDKAEYLDFYIVSGRMKWQSQDLDDVRIRSCGSVSVLTCRIHDRATFDGNELDAHFRSTQVFVKHADGWRYLAGQTTAIETT